MFTFFKINIYKNVIFCIFFLLSLLYRKGTEPLPQNQGTYQTESFVYHYTLSSESTSAPSPAAYLVCQPEQHAEEASQVSLSGRQLTSA